MMHAIDALGVESFFDPFSQDRPLKNAFAIVTLSALLSACAVAPQPVAAPDAAQLVPPGEAGAAATSDEVLPDVELSSDLLYKLTKAEIEFKRGQWQGPYVTLMGVAQQTRDPRIAHRAAEMALAAKQGGEALAAIRLWRELAPNSEEANQYFLGFAVLGDSLDEAEQVFVKRLQDAAPAARGVAMFQMMQFLSRAKNKAAAFALLERVLAPYAKVPETHLVLAQGAFANGDGARAVMEARQALAASPASELAILTLAQVTADPGTVDAMLKSFLVRNPAAREVRAAYARILIDQKQYEAARQQFLTLQKGQPDNLATLYALGIMSMQLNEAGVAEGYFKQFLALLEKHPNEEGDPSKVLTILSQLAEERGDVDAALAWLDKVDDSEPHAFFNAHIRRAQLFAKRGDVDGGRKVLAQTATADSSEQTQILLADAQILRDAGYGPTAYTVLENGLKRFPGNTELLYDFALAAEKVGKLDVMEASLLQVIAQSPDNQQAYNALGYSLAERNIRLPEAYTLIEKALTMAPGDPFIMDSMGWVQFRMGHLQQAEDLLRQAYALRNDPEIAVHLGEVLWQKGDQSDARKFWRDALAKDPKNDALKNTLARLNLSL